MDEISGLFMGISMGIGLAAATGFRVFVPFLVTSLAVNAGYMEISEDWAWIGSWPAIAAFGTASVVEVGAYYIPWVDNALDSLATPAAAVAGTLATSAMIGDMNPMMEWSIAIIAGGGTATAVQLGTVATRGTSTATTGGAGNPIVSTAELGGAAVTASIAVFIPFVVLVLVAMILFWVVRRIFFKKKAKETIEEETPPVDLPAS